MANATTPQAELKTFEISYFVRDGEHQYGDTVKAHCKKEPITNAELVEAILTEWSFCGELDEEEKKELAQCIREYEKDGYFELPHDYRIVNDISVREPDHLLEAAPQLLEALEAALLLLEVAKGSDCIPPDAEFPKIKSIIAKARGE